MTLAFLTLGATLLLSGLTGYLIRQIFPQASTTRAATLQIADTAERDVLTGLPNHMRLNDRISLAIRSGASSEEKTRGAVFGFGCL